MSKKRSRASSLASNDASPSSSAHASSSKSSTSTPSGPLVHASQDLDEFQESFWKYHMDLVEQGGDGEGGIIDFKSGTPTGGQLPLARIKKVMKSDDQVKMISAEAPILFARACEIFISDLTCRAFLIAEEHKRRTIQRSDIAGAIGRSDLFDFLIDIVPRHESLPSSRLPGNRAAKVEKTAEGQNSGRAKSAAAATARARLQDQAQQSYQLTSDGQTQQHLANADTSDATSHYVDLDGQRGQLALSSSNSAHDDMSSWLHDSATDNTTSATGSGAQDTHSHLDYAATTVPHAWQHSFADLGSHNSHASSVDDRAHVPGLDSIF